MWKNLKQKLPNHSLLILNWFIGVCILSYVVFEVMTLRALVYEVVQRLDEMPEYTLVRK
jgi:hypothetical protein